MDFSDEFLDHKYVPFVFILSPFVLTEIDLVDKNDEKVRKVEIPKGAGLLMHGVCPHAGQVCHYPRVHFYLLRHGQELDME